MLGLNLPFALFITLILGLSGLPLGLWLRRRENLALLDTLVISYALGWVLVPLVFLLESLIGIRYAPLWIALNWLAVAGAGLALLWREGALVPASIAKSLRFSLPADPMPFLRAALPGLALVLLLFLTVIIRLTSAGGIIFELDPYFYLDGVRQVVYAGHNFYDDRTAWVSAAADAGISHHVGQPLYKYLLASWYSLYNGAAAYSPYTLMDIGGVYPPLAAGLAVFFIYLFFREIYNERAGIMAGGLAAFLPFFILKGQGGDAQIVPYSIFAIFFFLAMFYLMLKRRSWIFTALAGLAYGTIILGSNIEILLVFCLSLLLFGIGLRHILDPDEESRLLNRQLLVFLGLMLLVQIIWLWYSSYQPTLKDLIVSMVESVGIPAVALLLPLAFDWLAEMPKRAAKSAPPAGHANASHDAHGHLIAPSAAAAGLFAPLHSVFDAIESASRPVLMPAANVVGGIDRFWRAVFFVAFLGAIAILAPRLPGLDLLVQQYQFWGAYYEPLYRTIAEQAGGAPSFDGSFGFVAMVLNPDSFPATGLTGIVLHYGVQILAVLNAMPTMLINLAYNSMAGLLNVLLFPNGDGNFITVERVNSLATFFLFFGPLLLAVNWLRDVWASKAHWPLAPMLLLSFIVPITFMGFEKQKLLTYLGMALIMAAAATVGEFEGLMRWWASRKSASTSSSASIHSSSGAAGHASGAAGHASSGSAPFWSAWPVPARYLVWALVISIVLLEMGILNLAPAWGAPLLSTASIPTFEQAPVQTVARFSALCQSTGDPGFCQAANINVTSIRDDPLAFYNPNLCYLSLLPNSTVAQPPPAISMALQYRCGFLSPYWLSSMEWISQNMGNDTTVGSGNRVISWWDYGHWINFFGQSNTVLRNEHNSRDMIGRTAYSYLDSDAAGLRDTMKTYDARYALMDVEIVGGGSADAIQYGGKYGALNYLGCAYVNQTTVNTPLGSSACETSHLWETIIVPSQPQTAQTCVISQSTQQTGYVAYRMAYARTPQGVQQQPQPAYCVTGGMLANGQQGVLSYDLSKRDANGDLALHPAVWAAQGNDGTYLYFGAVYDHQKLWSVNNTLVESWPYRVGAFYDSPLYQGFFLNQLPGYDLVYNSPQIRIYKMTDAAWAAARAG